MYCIHYVQLTPTDLFSLFRGTSVIFFTTAATGSERTLTPLTSRIVSPGNSPLMKAGEPGLTLWTNTRISWPSSEGRP